MCLRGFCCVFRPCRLGRVAAWSPAFFVLPVTVRAVVVPAVWEALAEAGPA